MVFAPFLGFRLVEVIGRRTSIDWTLLSQKLAHEVCPESDIQEEIQDRCIERHASLSRFRSRNSTVRNAGPSLSPWLSATCAEQLQRKQRTRSPTPDIVRPSRRARVLPLQSCDAVSGYSRCRTRWIRGPRQWPPEGWPETGRIAGVCHLLGHRVRRAQPDSARVQPPDPGIYANVVQGYQVACFPGHNDQAQHAPSGKRGLNQERTKSDRPAAIAARCLRNVSRAAPISTLRELSCESSRSRRGR